VQYDEDGNLEPYDPGMDSWIVCQKVEVTGTAIATLPVGNFGIKVTADFTLDDGSIEAIARFLKLFYSGCLTAGRFPAA